MVWFLQRGGKGGEGEKKQERRAGMAIEAIIAGEENAATQKSIGPKVTAKNGLPHVRLTKRDEDLLVFLFDQKFATIEAVYLRFFDQREKPSDPCPAGYYTTRQRLGLLQKHGFVKTAKVYTESKSVYLLGPSGYKILQARGLTYGPPIQTVDFRQYEHDLKVTYCRIALERQGKAVRWYSERRIRMKGFEVGGELHRLKKDGIIPDGIFLSPKGDLVAFELECAQRMLSRFERKASDYRSLMYEGIIQKVLWVADSDKLAHDLTSVISGRSNFFVDRYETYSKCLMAGGIG